MASQNPPIGMRVRDLIDLLEQEDPEAFIAFVSDYGDHGHTQQVHSLLGEVEEVELERSGYSDSGWAVREPDEIDGDEDDGTDAPTILVIR